MEQQLIKSGKTILAVLRSQLLSMNIEKLARNGR